MAKAVEVVQVVEVVGVESNTRPPASNPEYTAVPTQSTLTVPSASETRTRARPRLQKNLGRERFGLKCPHCKRETITIVEDRVGMGTIVATIIIAIIFWPLCWLPFCVPTCKRTYHFCGHDECNKKIGVTNVCA